TSHSADVLSTLPPLSSPSSSSTAPAPPHLYTLSLHDALPISSQSLVSCLADTSQSSLSDAQSYHSPHPGAQRSSHEKPKRQPARSEEHTSELQSLRHLVCRLLLEKKKIKITHLPLYHHTASN